MTDEFSSSEKDILINNAINRKFQLTNKFNQSKKSNTPSYDSNTIEIGSPSVLNKSSPKNEMQLEETPFIKMSQSKSLFRTGGDEIEKNLTLSGDYDNNMANYHASFSYNAKSSNINSGNTLNPQRQTYSPPRKKSHFLLDPNREETSGIGGSKKISQMQLGLCSCKNVLLCDDDNFNL